MTYNTYDTEYLKVTIITATHYVYVKYIYVYKWWGGFSERLQVCNYRCTICLDGRCHYGCHVLKYDTVFKCREVIKKKSSQTLLYRLAVTRALAIDKCVIVRVTVVG